MIVSVPQWFLRAISDFIPDQLEGVRFTFIHQRQQSSQIPLKRNSLTQMYLKTMLTNLKGTRFGCDDYDEDDNDYEDDIENFKASDRYQLTEENVTQSDMMKI